MSAMNQRQGKKGRRSDRNRLVTFAGCAPPAMKALYWYCGHVRYLGLYSVVPLSAVRVNKTPLGEDISALLSNTVSSNCMCVDT